MKENKKQSVFDNLQFILLACLTLGLAPFYPEPHILGKIRWIAGGAKGMGAMDWLDTLMHGIPWLLLLNYFARKVDGKIRS